jgi:hypothetical protein
MIGFHSLKNVVLLHMAAVVLSFPAGVDSCADAPPETPHIDSVIMVRPQPHESAPEVIWYDDFDGPAKRYTEAEGAVVAEEAFGASGGSMLAHYDRGSRGMGNRKVFFGDSPTGDVVNPGRSYQEVYWRIYVKHQHGWTGGGPAKLSRATSIVSSNWAQAMIAHVWSDDDALTLDPASGVRGDKVVTTKYNDFDNLRWLGNRPASPMKLFSPEETGRWVCVEARVKLNAPGRRDGVNQLWIDGRLEAERTGLDWRGSYTGHGINAVFLETYWNEGSPVTQSRWIDNFVISTVPIGPVVVPRNPVLIKTPYREPGGQKAWQVEVAADEAGSSVVWRSGTIGAPGRVRIDDKAGRFVGRLSGRDRLAAGQIHFVRVRQQSPTGEWSAWGGWHQPFETQR